MRELIDKWRVSTGITRMGPAGRHQFTGRKACADEIEAWLNSLWTEITDDSDTWPTIQEQFFGAWVDGGKLDGIEWYGWSGHALRFWNLNSNNLNEWDEETRLAANGTRMFTHWRPLCDIDTPPKKN